MNLGEQAKDRVLSAAELLARHRSLVNEFFKYEETNKPEILRNALREQIEKIESHLLKTEILA